MRDFIVALVPTNAIAAAASDSILPLLIFTMTFASNAAYTTYLGHPTHQRLVREVLEPNVDRFAVYDFQPKSAQ